MYLGNVLKLTSLFFFLNFSKLKIIDAAICHNYLGSEISLVGSQCRLGFAGSG